MAKKNKQENLFKIEYKINDSLYSRYVVADNLNEALDKYFNFGKSDGWLKIANIPECINQITAMSTEDGSGSKVA